MSDKIIAGKTHQEIQKGVRLIRCKTVEITYKKPSGKEERITIPIADICYNNDSKSFELFPTVTKIVDYVTVTLEGENGDTNVGSVTINFKGNKTPINARMINFLIMNSAGPDERVGFLLYLGRCLN